jgi:hypothetical protein
MFLPAGCRSLRHIVPRRLHQNRSSLSIYLLTFAVFSDVLFLQVVAMPTALCFTVLTYSETRSGNYNFDEFSPCCFPKSSVSPACVSAYNGVIQLSYHSSINSGSGGCLCGFPMLMFGLVQGLYS